MTESEKNVEPHEDYKQAFAVNDCDNLNGDDQILDTGASCLLIRDESMLTKAEHWGIKEVVRQPDGTPLKCRKSGLIDVVDTDIELWCAYYGQEVWYRWPFGRPRVFARRVKWKTYSLKEWICGIIRCDEESRDDCGSTSNKRGSTWY